ncbi:MAG: hypothetical protein ACF8QF_12050 [Phycisphaerales bacterium]
MRGTSALAIALCLGACGAKPATDPAPLATDRAPAPARQQATQTDSPTVDPAPDAERAGPVAPTTRQPVASDAQPTQARALPTPERRVADGRPEWWLREPQWAEARLTICAEALGASVRDARRAAVDAGLAELRTLLEQETPDAEVVVTTVRPLPVPAQAPGGMRYVGYVMVSARTDDAGAH